MSSDMQRRHWLTPRGERANRLAEFGVPATFISTVRKLKKRRDALGYALLNESSAYDYLLTSDWDDLTGAEVTPLATGCNGDTFYLAVTRIGKSEFVDFCLESGITNRFATFNDLVVDILESVADDMETDAELMAVAAEIGYSGSISLSDLEP